MISLNFKKFSIFVSFNIYHILLRHEFLESFSYRLKGETQLIGEWIHFGHHHRVGIHTLSLSWKKWSSSYYLRFDESLFDFDGTLTNLYSIAKKMNCPNRSNKFRIHHYWSYTVTTRSIIAKSNESSCSRVNIPTHIKNRADVMDPSLDSRKNESPEPFETISRTALLRVKRKHTFCSSFENGW